MIEVAQPSGIDERSMAPYPKQEKAESQDNMRATLEAKKKEEEQCNGIGTKPTKMNKELKDNETGMPDASTCNEKMQEIIAMYNMHFNPDLQDERSKLGSSWTYLLLLYRNKPYEFSTNELKKSRAYLIQSVPKAQKWIIAFLSSIDPSIIKRHADEAINFHSVSIDGTSTPFDVILPAQCISVFDRISGDQITDDCREELPKMEDVLKKLQMEGYGDRFREEKITTDCLLDMDFARLRKLKIPMGDIIYLLREIDALRLLDQKIKNRRTAKIHHEETPHVDVNAEVKMLRKELEELKRRSTEGKTVVRRVITRKATPAEIAQRAETKEPAPAQTTAAPAQAAPAAQSSPVQGAPSTSNATAAPTTMV